MLPCLSKASADVKKTDRSSLSRRFYATALIIYLLAVMATVGDARCMWFLNTLTNANDTRGSAPHENPGVKPIEATLAKHGLCVTL